MDQQTQSLIDLQLKMILRFSKLKKIWQPLFPQHYAISKKDKVVKVTYPPESKDLQFRNGEEMFEECAGMRNQALPSMQDGD